MHKISKCHRVNAWLLYRAPWDIDVNVRYAYRRPEVTSLIFNFDGTVQSGNGDPRQVQVGVRVCQGKQWQRPATLGEKSAC